MNKTYFIDQSTSLILVIFISLIFTILGILYAKKFRGINNYLTANRNIGYIIDVLGNKSIQSYTSAEAGKFRDWLIEKGMLYSTVKRVFSSIRAIINLSISEYGLNIINPFSKVYLPSIDNELRMSIPMD